MPDIRSNPYPGPRPFTDQEYRVFAGRDHEISEVSSLIVAHRPVLLYARSGAGKTSLLNAGLRHALSEKGMQVTPSVHVGIPPAKTVHIEKVRNVYTYSALSTLLPDFSPEEEFLWQATLAESLQRIPKKLDRDGEPILRVIPFDQFEELFSAYPERWKNRREFFQEIAEALLADVSLRVLFLLREDYLADFAELASELSDGGRTRYRLDLLREQEALLAVQRPLEGTNWSFAAGVAESLVKDLTLAKGSRSAGDETPVWGEFVEPVQLQVVCYELLERLPPEVTEIKSNDLVAFGGVEEALRKFYDRVVQTAVRETGVNESELRSWFRTYLITPAYTRGLVFQDLVSTGGIPNEVVAVLEREHIVRAELRSGFRWFELTHDRLIQPILSANREFEYAAKTKEVDAATEQKVAGITTLVRFDPVGPSPLSPQTPTSGVALCLSGGGYRSMLFHLGALWRLNELHYLQQLDRVSSVSGGSITSGVLAMNWSNLGFDANGLAHNFDQQVTQPIRRMAAQSIDVSSILGGIFGGVSKQVADHYNTHLYNDAKLKDLPDDPHFVFNATSLQAGVLWRFSKSYMGDYKVGLVKNPDVELATAVAASSAFPPLLSPCVLNFDPESFDNTTDPPPTITSPDFRKQIVLCDGGVYDSFGLETTWNRNKTILVSNGAPDALGMEPDPKHDWLAQTNRVLAIIDSQVVTMRRRSILELFQLGVRDGSYWGVGSNIQNYQLPDALVCPFDVTTKLSQTATRLTAMDNQLQQQLIDWGYAVCDAAMRKHVLPAGAPAPQSSPYGTFKRP